MADTKIKVGIHLPNRNNSKTKLIDPTKGNPGVGGTQFLMFSLPFYMEKFFPGLYEFVFLAENIESIECSNRKILANSLSEAADICKKNKYELFIFRPTFDEETLNLLSTLNNSDLKAVAWMHNNPIFLLNHLSKHKNIVRCICVGREQYEVLRDHPIIKKCSLIPNALDESVINLPENIEKTKSVVFMGGLVFAKGFHKLAKLWKKVLKHHPDAKLHVIGSGKLYESNKRMGKYGIAEENYEKKFLKYLTDNNGKVNSSVIFHGLQGHEKYEIMSSAVLGIGNHPGLRETFCMAAAEFLLCATPVLSSPYGGLLDTVIHKKSGFLETSSRKRLCRIIELLSDIDLAKSMGINGRNCIIKKYNYLNHCKHWHNLLSEILSDSPVQILKNEKRGFYKFREFLRLIKRNRYICKFIPSTIYILHTIEYVKLKWDRI